jgi:hypothetical protein
MHIRKNLIPGQNLISRMALSLLPSRIRECFLVVLQPNIYFSAYFNAVQWNDPLGTVKPRNAFNSGAGIETRN